MSCAAEMKQLVKQLREQQFDVSRVGNGHYQVIAPDGRKIQVACTPRYQTGVKNAITRLRRIGFRPPPSRPQKKVK